MLTIRRHPSKHARPEVDVVSSLVRAPRWQFAVISVRTAPYCERVVIAYPDEKTLRDLLAGPSIVALGYSSREEAEASIHRDRTTAQPLRQKSMVTLVVNSTQALKGFVSSHLLAKDKFSFCSRLSLRLLLSSIRRVCCPQPSAH
jgi:hypothetical protein